MTPVIDDQLNYKVYSDDSDCEFNSFVDQIDENMLMCYTDGSKIESGSVSSAIFVAINALTLDTCRFPLVKHATMFQAEVYAIEKAAEVIDRCRDYFQHKEVVICSDSSK